MRKISVLLILLLSLTLLVACGEQAEEVTGEDIEENNEEVGEVEEGEVDVTAEDSPEIKELKEKLISVQDADQELTNYINVYVGREAAEMDLFSIETEEDVSLLEEVKKKGGSLVEVMATWCPSCETIIPQLEEIQDLTNKKILTVVVFEEEEENIYNFIDRTGSTADYFWNKTDMSIGEYGIQYVPTMFYIDENGIIKGIFSQATSPQEVKELIDLM